MEPHVREKEKKELFRPGHVAPDELELLRRVAMELLDGLGLTIRTSLAAAISARMKAGGEA